MAYVSFARHKQVAATLCVAELIFAFIPFLERAYVLMGLVYIGVTYWWVFGEPRWRLYRVAGIAYAVFITFQYLLASLQLSLPRPAYHFFVAVLWATVFAVHVFAEREFQRE